MIPIELLHDGNDWVGTTHAIARCHSFQYLERLLAPNAATGVTDLSARVVTVQASQNLATLDAVESDADAAVHAATVLGLHPARYQIATPAEGLAALTGGSLVHYVGHGFANELGEFLLLSGESGISAAELDRAESPHLPFVFFSACLLGRARHSPGGRQKGWVISLLEGGAPAVVGALYPVPDHACVPFARAFYRGVWKSPVGEGMRLARVQLDRDGIHPAVWGSFVLHGDPLCAISTAVVSERRSAGDSTRRWPAWLTRSIATQQPKYGDAVLRGIQQEVKPGASPSTRDIADEWVRAGGAPSGGEAALEQSIRDILEFDPEGAGVLRIMLALQRAVHGSSDALRDLFTAYLVADALDDSYARLLILAEMLVRFRAHLNEEELHATRIEAERHLAALAGDVVDLGPLAARIAGTSRRSV